MKSGYSLFLYNLSYSFFGELFQDAQARPEAITGGDVAGMRNATSGSITDKLTREHRMTFDEACLILNVKKDDPMERILQVRIPHVLHLSHICNDCLSNSSITNTYSKRTLKQKVQQQQLQNPSRAHDNNQHPHIHITSTPKLFGQKSE